MTKQLVLWSFCPHSKMLLLKKQGEDKVNIEYMLEWTGFIVRWSSSFNYMKAQIFVGLNYAVIYSWTWCQYFCIQKDVFSRTHDSILCSLWQTKMSPNSEMDREKISMQHNTIESEWFCATLMLDWILQVQRRIGSSKLLRRTHYYMCISCSLLGLCNIDTLMTYDISLIFFPL